jgi:hypothetical protein
VTPTADDSQDNYSERDVSNWVLQSLKHCRVNDSPNGSADPTDSVVTLPIIAHELRPKIYNGRCGFFLNHRFGRKNCFRTNF